MQGKTAPRKSLLRSEWEERFPPRLRRRLLLALTGVTLTAICVRLPLLGTTYTAPDTSYYLQEAKTVFHGGYASNLRPPAYPTLLAFFELFGAEPATATVIFQNLIGVVMPALLLLVGWRFFGPWAGVAAGFLMAASPLAFAIEQFALTDYLFSVVLFVAVAVLAEAALKIRRDNVPWGLLVASGALFGLATLLRANGFYAIVAIPLVLLPWAPRWKPALQASGVAAGVLVLVIAPWCIYGAIRFDDLTIASEGGLSLYSRAISYDEVAPPADTEAGRIARDVYNTADPNQGEATVGTTTHVYEALVTELGLDQAEATGKMGDIAREAIAEDPGTYVADSLRLLTRYQGVYYPRTLGGRGGRDQVSLASGYAGTLDLEHQTPTHSGFVRVPWGLAQAVTDLLFILTAGGLLFLVLPFLGDRRSRMAGTAFLVFGFLGFVVVTLTARFELRHGIVFAPFVWILAPATVLAVGRLLVARTGRLRPRRLRTRHATS